MSMSVSSCSAARNAALSVRASRIVESLAFASGWSTTRTSIKCHPNDGPHPELDLIARLRKTTAFFESLPRQWLRPLVLSGIALIASATMTHASRRQFLAACGLAVVPTALTGCGLLEGSEGDSEGNGQVETAKLQIGTMPIVGAAPLGLAQKRGLFKKNGLDVTPTKIQSGAMAIPNLAGGDMQITFSNYVSFIGAKAKGIDVRIIAEASRAAPENFAVVTRKDTQIHEPKDLRGKLIGVNAKQNIATVTTSSVLRSHGVEPHEVEYVEVVFP